MEAITLATPVASEVRVSLRPVTYSLRLLCAIKHAFKGDTDLAKYHITPCIKTTSMAQATYRAIGESIGQKAGALRCYSVYIQSNERGSSFTLMGFSVLCLWPIPILFSFGIRKEYRTRELLMMWLEAVSEKFEGRNYAVTLNQKNTRAIRFFERNGFKQQRVANKALKIVCLTK